MKKAASILLLLLSGCITLPTGNTQFSPYQERTLQEGTDKKVLVIDISGMIVDQKEKNILGDEKRMNMTARIREQLDKAREDTAIRGLIIKIDSPGGSVATSDILYHEILRYKKDTGVHVIALLNNVAASGGYYVATAADAIIAHPTTITGSIGVILTMFNIEGLMNKVGIQDQTIASGEAKSMGSIFREMSPKEQELFEDIIDAMYERFITVILNGRKNMTRETLMPIADGRVLIAEDAQKAGLIDATGYWEDTLALFENETGTSDPTVISYNRAEEYMPNIYAGAHMQSSGLLTALAGDVNLFYSKYGISFMYLWKP